MTIKQDQELLCAAALDHATNLPDGMKAYHLQKGAGHYGMFNGGKSRREIAPRIAKFIREYDRETGTRRSRVTAVPAWQGAAGGE